MLHKILYINIWGEEMIKEVLKESKEGIKGKKFKAICLYVIYIVLK